MTTMRTLPALLAASAALALSAPAARAASSYDACTGFIAALPATISTQGVWCFNKDLNTAMASGRAITVAANNVTIDCNGFKLGGLQAGLSTQTVGIWANGRSNTSIRDCNIRGFATGVSLEGSEGGGHRVERNRFEANTLGGLVVVGDGSLVRDNLVLDTGGSTSGVGPQSIFAIGGSGQVDVVDNQVHGVDSAGSSNNEAMGILYYGATGASIHRNRVGGLVFDEESEGGAAAVALMMGGVADVRGNTLSSLYPAVSVYCSSDDHVLHENALLTAIEPQGGCGNGGDNYGLPSPE